MHEAHIVQNVTKEYRELMVGFCRVIYIYITECIIRKADDGTKEDSGLWVRRLV